MPTALELPGSLMLVACCECGEFLHSKPGPLNVISHTICPECLPGQMQKVKEHVEANREKANDK